MSSDLLGEFERLVLLAILQRGEAAYALPVRKAIESVTERAISRGALYRTLDRMEAKGLVAHDFEEADETRGGNPRKVFRVTGAGLEALRRSHAITARMEAGLERLLGGPA